MSTNLLLSLRKLSATNEIQTHAQSDRLTADRPTERQTTGEIRLQTHTDKGTGGWGGTTKCKKSD